MHPGFQSEFFTVATGDGRHCILAEQQVYVALDGRVFIIPAGAPTDGASTPAIIWAQIPPWGTYWRAAILHDSSYQNTLRIAVFPDGKICSDLSIATQVVAGLEKDDCDNLLFEAMGFCGTHDLTRNEIFHGVHLFGQSSFDEDRRINP